MSFLLDTNIISELVKPHPQANVAAWVRNTEENLLHLSVLTIGEIRKGIDSLPLTSRRSALEAWLSSDLKLRFFGRILPVDEDVAGRWGKISAGTKTNQMPVIDGLLAATALHHGLTFVTCNTRHVAATGVRVLNPRGTSTLKFLQLLTRTIAGPAKSSLLTREI